MADDADDTGWISERTGLTLLALIGLSLGALVILPYLQYILLGVVLAYILTPAQRRLERVVGATTSALALVAVAILAILLPTIYVLAIAFQQALQVITAIQEGTLDVADIEQHLESSGITVDLADLYETYQEPIGTALQGFATTGIEIVGGVPAILIGLTVTLFVLFALLRDGDRFVVWTQSVIPVDDAVQRELHDELDQLMWASVVGNVAVAAIQAVLLGVGLALLGVPAVVFLTVATFVLALLPLVGAFGVWVPVAGYLLLVGQFVPAAILVVYGALVSGSDTYLRPALIGKTGALNAAIIVVGIFGGIVVFGAVGLFIGPVVLGGAKVILDLFARERSVPSDDPVGAETADTDIETQIDTDTDVRPADATDSTADAATDTDPDTGIRSGVDSDSSRDDSEETAPAAEDTTRTNENDTVTESGPSATAQSDSENDRSS